MNRSENLIDRSKSRRTQVERRRETQSSVLEACVEVLLDHGFSGLTAAEVASRAGVSRGALAHYFRTREDLIFGAMEHAMEQGTSASLANARRARNADDPVRAFIDDAERFFLHPSYVAMMELLVASRTNPSLGKAFFSLVERWRDEVNDIWLEAFADAGVPEDQAWQILHFTNNLLRGLALTSIWSSDKKQLDAVAKSWRSTLENGLRLKPDKAGTTT